MTAREGERRFGWRYVRRVSIVILAAALVAALLAVWFSAEVRWFHLGRLFLMGLTYSCCIGLPCGLLLPLLDRRINRWPRHWHLAAVMSAILVLVAAGCLAAGLILLALGVTPRRSFWEDYLFALRISVVIGLGAGMASYLYESLRAELEETQLQLRTKELEQERALKLAAEARLSALESRLHPHFLFNTLNSIAALIHEEPKRAEDMLGKLAALLRFSLDAQQYSLVPLGREMKVVRDYLEIEKARFGDRLRYAIEVGPELEPLEVPPLALQSLVENCIKHVIAPRRERGEIRITGRMNGECLELAVADSGPGFPPEAIPSGHGLDNLQSRLAVLFGPDSRLETLAEGGRAVVRVSLPQGPRRTAAMI